MKRFVQYVLCGCMAFVLFACSDNTVLKESESVEKDVSTETESSVQQEQTVNNDEIDSSFKAAMDSYEAFFDEYVVFMKKYEESDDPTSLLTEYSTYMTKYADTMEKIDTIDENELNDAELQYYTEVNLRISQKLLEVSN